MNFDDFRWMLEQTCRDYAGYANAGAGKNWDSFSNDWQVRITFMPKVGMSLDQFLHGLNKKGQDQKKFYEQNITVWVSDASNPIPEVLSRQNIVSDKNFDEENFMLLKIPKVTNKQELQEFLSDLSLEEPSGYLTTDLDIAVQVLTLRYSVKKTFREIALMIHPRIKDEALKAKEETYRKLYTKLVKEIIRPPYLIKRK